jgi:phage baseplate assembly protein W
MINISNLTSKKNGKTFVFSDLDLNFQEAKVSKNRGNDDFAAGNDLVINTDEEAIKNSIRNLLFQTRHLSDVNINLKSYIGEPISEFRGVVLGEDINKVLTLYEPRIKVEKIYVFADIDRSQYIISILTKIKNLGDSFKLNFSFSRNGSFNFINI